MKDSLIELQTNQRIIPGETLLFIDEIQNSEVALKQLRYFYEVMRQLHVVAAGSLLDVFINRNQFEIPVGRFEYCYLHPCTFDEFLLATGNNAALKPLNEIKISAQIHPATHTILFQLFLSYALIGGMPEVVAKYAKGETPLALDRVYESLLTGYRDDIGKYATPAQAVYLRHCLENTPRSVGMQITYNHFAEVRALFTETQKTEFDNIISDVIKKMNGRPPHPPHEGHGPPPPPNGPPPPPDGR